MCGEWRGVVKVGVAKGGVVKEGCSKGGVVKGQVVKGCGEKGVETSLDQRRPSELEAPTKCLNVAHKCQESNHWHMTTF